MGLLNQRGNRGYKNFSFNNKKPKLNWFFLFVTFLIVLAFLLIWFLIWFYIPHLILSNDYCNILYDYNFLAIDLVNEINSKGLIIITYLIISLFLLTNFFKYTLPKIYDYFNLLEYYNNSWIFKIFNQGDYILMSWFWWCCGGDSNNNEEENNNSDSGNNNVDAPNSPIQEESNKKDNSNILANSSNDSIKYSNATAGPSLDPVENSNATAGPSQNPAEESTDLIAKKQNPNTIKVIDYAFKTTKEIEIPRTEGDPILPDMGDKETTEPYDSEGSKHPWQENSKKLQSLYSDIKKTTIGNVLNYNPIIAEDLIKKVVDFKESKGISTEKILTESQLENIESTLWEDDLKQLKKNQSIWPAKKARLEREEQERREAEEREERERREAEAQEASTSTIEESTTTREEASSTLEEANSRIIEDSSSQESSNPDPFTDPVDDSAVSPIATSSSKGKGKEKEVSNTFDNPDDDDNDFY
jgi:signal transduction histidine kinase